MRGREVVSHLFLHENFTFSFLGGGISTSCQLQQDYPQIHRYLALQTVSHTSTKCSFLCLTVLHTPYFTES